jgi:hypothetical protein
VQRLHRKAQGEAVRRTFKVYFVWPKDAGPADGFWQGNKPGDDFNFQKQYFVGPRKFLFVDALNNPDLAPLIGGLWIEQNARPPGSG